MFDLSWGELLLVGAVALVVIGPRELPRVLRTVGQTLAKLRRMAGEFQSQFNAAMHEAELDEIRQAVNKAQENASSALNIDSSSVFKPLQTVRDELRSAIKNKDADSQPTSQSYSATSDIDIPLGEKNDYSVAPISPMPGAVQHGASLGGTPSIKISKDIARAGRSIERRYRKPPKVIMAAPSDAVKPLAKPGKGESRLYKKTKFSPFPARNRRKRKSVDHHKLDNV